MASRKLKIFGTRAHPNMPKRYTRKVEDVKEIRCYYLGRDSEENWCRLGNNETGMDRIFKNINYLSVNDTKTTNAHLFEQEAPARPDLNIKFKEPVVCEVAAYSGYKFDELKIINCGSG